MRKIELESQGIKETVVDEVGAARSELADIAEQGHDIQVQLLEQEEARREQEGRAAARRRAELEDKARRRLAKLEERAAQARACWRRLARPPRRRRMAPPRPYSYTPYSYTQVEGAGS